MSMSTRTTSSAPKLQASDSSFVSKFSTAHLIASSGALPSRPSLIFFSSLSVHIFDITVLLFLIPFFSDNGHLAGSPLSEFVRERPCKILEKSPQIGRAHV